MKDQKTQIGFEKLEEDLRGLGKDRPAMGMNPSFKDELRNRLKDNFHLQEAEGEKSIFDKVVEGLTSWSKMPVWGAMAATVAVVLIAINFGPKFAAKDFEKSVKKEIQTKQSEKQKDEQNNSESTESADKDSVNNSSTADSPVNEGSNGSTSVTPNNSSSAGSPVNEGSSSSTSITPDNSWWLPGSSSDTVEEDKPSTQIEPQTVPNESVPQDPIESQPTNDSTDSTGVSGDANITPSTAAPADTPMNLEETATVSLQLQTEGLLTDQIAAIQTDLTGIVDADSLQINIIDEETATLEISLSPRQIDALTSRLKTRSTDRQLMGEREINRISRTRESKVKVHLTLRNTSLLRR